MSSAPRPHERTLTLHRVAEEMARSESHFSCSFMPRLNLSQRRRTRQGDIRASSRSAFTRLSV